MTANEMIPAVGTLVLVAYEQINVACEVRDVKYSWGRPRLLVQPAKGNGEQWVDFDRVRRGEVQLL